LRRYVQSSLAEKKENLMKCPECGADLSSADKFCNNCGAAAPGGDAVGGSETAETTPGASEAAQPAPDAIPGDDTQLEEIEPVEPVAGPDLEPPAPPEEIPAASASSDFGPAAAAPPPPPPVVKAKGKSNTGLIIAIVVLVILLLCCCCAIGVIVANFDQISTALEGYY
jgi:hypothetical protein